jgi:hypothetical protein
MFLFKLTRVSGTRCQAHDRIDPEELVKQRVQRDVVELGLLGRRTHPKRGALSLRMHLSDDLDRLISGFGGRHVRREIFVGKVGEQDVLGNAEVVLRN